MPKSNRAYAYELYASLGEKRTYAKVAEILGLSETTVRQWGAQEKWVQRISAENADKAELIKSKREELECLGLEVAIEAMQKLKKNIKNGVLDSDMALIYEKMLKNPFSITAGVRDQTAYAASNQENTEDSKIEIVFDIRGGVSSED